MNIRTILKVKILERIKKYKSYGFFQIMMTIESRMVRKFWACTPISSKNTCRFWCLFLNSHLTTHHSNIVVQSSNNDHERYAYFTSF